MSVAAGAVLADRYRLDDLLAVGGMGQVWRARDTLLEREVAVKVLRPELTDDATVRARFRGEARHAAAVRHPAVATVHDYGEVPEPADEVTAYLVMDLVDGRPLDQVLAERGRLDAPVALDVAAQVADALAAAHDIGLVHRDVKPGNLLLDEGGHVTVTDFGIARAVDAAPVTATGLVMGTAEYLAPEQAGGGRATAASDVYALGVVAYEALSGHPPFHDGTPAQIAQAQVSDAVEPLPADVPAAAARIVLACLVKRPERRPDARTLSRRFRRVAVGTDDAADLAPASADLAPPSTEPTSGSPATATPAAPAVAPAPASSAAAAGPVASGERRQDTSALPSVPSPRQRAGTADQVARRRPPAGDQPAGDQPAADQPATGRTTYGRPRGPSRPPVLAVRAPLLVLVLLVVLLLLTAVLRSAGVLDAAPAVQPGPPGLDSTDVAAAPVASSPAPDRRLDVGASRAATETKDGMG